MNRWLFIFVLPVFSFLLVKPTAQLPVASANPVLDTNMISGYHYFIKQGVIIDENTNIDLLNSIFPRIGIPHKSRNSREGIDCSALVKLIYKEVFDKELGGSSADIFRYSTKIEREELKEGDLVFFRIESERINHVALYINNNKFVHSSSATGVSINDLNQNYYERYFYKAARPPL
jgi:murein DD-endopeptidase / murein LD-carboxypeptidase